MQFLIAWALQPTSVAGLSAIMGTLVAAFTHQLNWAQALPVLAGAVTSIIVPDNSAIKAKAESLVQDIVGTSPKP